MRAEDVKFHAMLLADCERLDAYGAAIREVVAPGDIVVDVGTGSGVLALMAWKAGARRVYAVERTDIAGIAKEVICANGAEDIVRVVAADFTDFEPPEPVDVVVSELISKQALGQRMESLMAHARKYLRTGGRILPERVRYLAAPVSRVSDYGDGFQTGDLDFEPLERRLANSLRPVRLKDEDRLGAGIELHVSELSTAAQDSFTARARLSVAREGVFRGVGLWFDAELSPTRSLSTEPPGGGAWGHVAIPSPRAVAVEPGAEIELELRGWHPTLSEPLYEWTCSLLRAGSETETFSGSTFSGQPLTAQSLRRRMRSHRPRLGARGALLRAVLCACDGERSVSDVVQRLSSEGTATEAEIAQLINLLQEDGSLQ